MWPEFLRHPLIWSCSVFLGTVWLSRLFAVALNMNKIVEITLPEYDVLPVGASGSVPRVSIIVPARNEADHIEAALVSLLQLDYPDYEVIAVDDRSEDATGEILDRLESQWRQREEAAHHRLTVLHVSELPAGWLGKTHAMWQAGKRATRRVVAFHRCGRGFPGRCAASRAGVCGAGAGRSSCAVSDHGDGVGG